VNYTGWSGGCQGGGESWASASSLRLQAAPDHGGDGEGLLLSIDEARARHQRWPRTHEQAG